MRHRIVTALSHSIPHNVAIRQANLSSNLESHINATVSSTFGTHYTPVQTQALELYGLGLNVFPQPHGKKAGLPWRQLQYTRLHPTHPTAGVAALFQRKCNIAVMCGRTSRNLFVIDCESQQALEHHTTELRKRGIPLWIVETARGGHIYLKCSDGEVANVESGVMQDAEIRGCRVYVLAAGSVHPTGAIYHWATREGANIPEVSIKNIDWLRDMRGLPIRLRLTTTKGAKTARFSPLSRATQDYLTNGDQIGEGSRNNRLFSAACDMAGNDYELSETESKLIPVAERSGLARNEIFATIRSAYARDRKPARPQAQPRKLEVSDTWKHASAFAESHQWDGRTGTSDKLIFLALIERAKSASNENDVFRASTRELSVLSRTSINTVQSALKRLKNANYVFYAGQDKTSQAHLWRFSTLIIKEGQLKSDTFTATPPWISCSDSIFNSTDVLERGALGYTGYSIYKAMVAADCAMMPSQIAVSMGVPVHRVNYALRKLSSYGLVVREKSGWRALVVSDDELDERVSRPSGKLGRGVARRERYAEQRAVYVGKIIARANAAAFHDEMLYHQHELEQTLISHTCSKTNSSFILREVQNTSEESLKLWKCPNCGQVHFAEEPPDMCDFCRDFTTWKPLEGGVDDEDAEILSDPMVLLALELGAEVYMIEDGKRRLVASQPRSNAPSD